MSFGSSVDWSVRMKLVSRTADNTVLFVSVEVLRSRILFVATLPWATVLFVGIVLNSTALGFRDRRRTLRIHGLAVDCK